MARLRRIGGDSEAQKANRIRKPGSGRVKGSRNKLSLSFCAALSDDFDQHGEEVIRKVRQYDPTAYLKIIAAILPKELEVKVKNPMDAWQEQAGISDEMMVRVLDEVLAQMRAIDREQGVIEHGPAALPAPESGAMRHPGVD